MSVEHEMRRVSSRIERLVAELETLSDPAARNRVEEIVRLVLQLHGEGLTRILGVIQQPDGTPPLERLAMDPVVATVLMLHDLHPHPLQTRITKALDLLRPVLGHRVGLSVLGVSDGAIRVGVDVARGGCGTSTEGITTAVKAAVWDAAPDARDVTVEMMGPVLPLIQLTRREVSR